MFRNINFLIVFFELEFFDLVFLKSSLTLTDIKNKLSAATDVVGTKKITLLFTRLIIDETWFKFGLKKWSEFLYIAWPIPATNRKIT